MYYQNDSEDATLREYVQFNKLENLTPMHPYEGMNIEIEVGPGNNEIVLFKRTQRACSFSCNYYSSVILSASKTQ